LGLSLVVANWSAEGATYKFYSGGDGYTGPYNGAGTVYDATKADPILCPSGHAGCGAADVIADPLLFPGLTVSSPSGVAGVNAPWLDSQPNFGGMGVSDDSATSGTGDDQITGSDILTLTFGSPFTLTGVGTLFDSGHTPFGTGFETPADVAAVSSTISFLMAVDAGGFVPVNFLLANNMGLNITGTTFSFMQAAGNPEFYVSAISGSAIPIPGALPLFASGLGVMAWMARRRKRKAAAEA
jgi:hypothetical protein